MSSNAPFDNFCTFDNLSNDFEGRCEAFVEDPRESDNRRGLSLRCLPVPLATRPGRPRTANKTQPRCDARAATNLICAKCQKHFPQEEGSLVFAPRARIIYGVAARGLFVTTNAFGARTCEKQASAAAGAGALLKHAAHQSHNLQRRETGETPFSCDRIRWRFLSSRAHMKNGGASINLNVNHAPHNINMAGRDAIRRLVTHPFRLRPPMAK
ncbi:hypothetical protein EVAR_52719_1 [Eumeta japonica]|uniref:Uncharacterized protein n=1 Tax=Eumeta variegata TaxID=151549 RepID=A0A4C1ZGP9_EUMVA|nr:hypothetical protein EVAR_52719_1 [Eumeta japonica]